MGKKRKMISHPQLWKKFANHPAIKARQPQREAVEEQKAPPPPAPKPEVPQPDVKKEAPQPAPKPVVRKEAPKPAPEPAVKKEAPQPPKKKAPPTTRKEEGPY